MTDEQLSEARRLCEAATAVIDRLGFCPECGYGANASPEPLMRNGFCPECNERFLLREFRRLFPVLLDAYQVQRLISRLEHPEDQ